MHLTGDLIVAGINETSSQTFRATNPASGEVIGPDFSMATQDQIDRACAAAAEAFVAFKETGPHQRAEFLEQIAANILDIGDELIVRAQAESGLPEARLVGERGRTVGQLRMFADLLRQGHYMGLRADTALPDREPLPRPDIRQRKTGIGPVAVFGASNFPLAFSVAGGDTASALAAGCPVIVKGHPAHPGTGNLCGGAIRNAVNACGLPSGVFSLLNGGVALGQALVSNPSIQAVGFTGSRAGGLAIAKAASERKVPIPVYAEMSSINPVILCPEALKARGEKLGAEFVGSLTMGAGQFCTNPGLVLAVESDGLEQFLAAAGAAVAASSSAQMLTDGIASAYKEGVEAIASLDQVRQVSRGANPEGPNRCQAALFDVSAKDFLATRQLQHEVFGASSIVVRCSSAGELQQVISSLEGQLTITIHADGGDLEALRPLMPHLEQKAGRILFNGWPTGVEVCPSMVHGGPFPATTDTRTSSVGTLAIDRFLRPVCYQNYPDALLPAELKRDNPLQFPILMNGRLVTQ